MLFEGLAYVLVEQGIVSKHQVIDAIEGVIEVGREIARTSEPVVVSITPIILLQDILNSIRAASKPQSPASEKRDEPRPTSGL